MTMQTEEKPKTGKIVLTNSSISTLRECPRKYQIKYELGIVPAIENENLRFGKLMHHGIEAWAHGGRNVEVAIAAINKLHASGYEPDEYELAKATALMEAYHERYKDEPYEIIVSEKEFRNPILNPETAAESRTFIGGGVIDMLLKDRSGRFLIKETKTTTEDVQDLTSNYWVNLLMDSQVSTYYMGAAVLGYPAETCLYDVIRKPSIRPRQIPLLDDQGVKIVHDAAGQRVKTKDGKKWRESGSEADGYTLQTRQETAQEFYQRLAADIVADPNRYFARREVPRSKNDLEEYLLDVWLISQALLMYRKRGSFPRNVRSCLGHYGTCAYFAACSGQTTLGDPVLFKKLDPGAIHSELNGKTKKEKRIDDNHSNSSNGSTNGNGSSADAAGQDHG